MKILGIDPGAGTTALILTEDGRDKLPLKAIEIKIKKGDGPGIARAEIIGERLTEAIQEWEPDVCVIEGYAYNKKFGMVANVEVGTLLRYAYRDWWWLRNREPEGPDGEWSCPRVPFYVASPTQLKKFATGRGNAPKDQVSMFVYKRWGFESPTEHIADAYALSQLGAAMYHDDIVVEYSWEGPEPTKVQIAIAAKVRKEGWGG